MKIINCSIVGLGRIGSTLEDDSLREKPASHAGAISAHPDCRLLSGCDRDKEKCELFEKRWKCHHVFQDFESMMSYEVPDILCIATPPDSHRDYVLKAIDKNIPMVICEKPLTEDLSQAREIIDTIAQSRTTLIVNHERRYSLDYLHCKEIIEKGLYGDLLSLNCKLFIGQNHTVEEMLWEDGTHMIDIMRFLTNEEITLVSVTGDLFKKAGESIIVMKLGSIYAVIDAACNRDHLVFELDLSFSRGMIKIGNGVYEEYKSKTSPFYENFKSLDKKQNQFFPKTNYFGGMFEDAVRSLRSDKINKEPVSTGVDGYCVVKVISDIISNSKNQ
ncbi:MAG: Gfo/Idh/MocA family oxidoreductase [Spirochaetales bacterium]|nr:Gfo/Idh/MocA family oxidoreductase [Spirochaetales bacterium]